MSCNPQTPIGDRIYDSDWVAFASIDTTNALGTGEPVKDEVLTLTSVMDGTEQAGYIQQIQVRETASSSANIKKPDLIVLLYTDSAPTTPTLNTVYNGSTTNLIGTFTVAEADYKRVSDTVWQATITPAYAFRTGTAATASNLYAVVLSNESTPVTFAASAGIALRVWTKPGA